VVVPPGGPKTKPNALNAAMDIVVRERCEFVTIYDAEDRPQPDQLLKAVGTFRVAGPRVACLQAELAFWNDDTNWVTALYWVGYKIHFKRFLPGLARLGMPVPLGGTSNHFRVSALLDVALRPTGDVWDPNNLTEDADLGARLALGGYQVDLLRSTTMEEAPDRIKVVDKQQRRWKAGYLQTGLVHTRRPFRSIRRMGLIRWLCFNFLVLSVPIGFLLNPLFMGLTLAYFATRAQLIIHLFPAGIYYLGLALMLVGNFALLYELVHTCLTDGQHSRGRFGLVRYMLLAQVMWLWMSRSTYIALFELFTGRRKWHKTPHGHAEPSYEEFSAVSPPRTRPMEPPRGRPAEPPRGRSMEPSRGRPVEPPRGRPVEPPRGRPMEPSQGRPAEPFTPRGPRPPVANPPRAAGYSTDGRR
jgi:glycosyltransferase XagB